MLLQGTAPIDMAEIPATGDIAYITASAVQLVSTKGIQLQDYAHYPYCLASTVLPREHGACLFIPFR